MRQIEQPMEYLIERTKHKCKRCTGFFSNEAALKQYHCEPQIKKEKWPHSSKTINHANNLEKPLRSCEKAPTHPSKQQIRQTTLDGPISLWNGPSTPTKLMVEEAQVGGAPVEHSERWKAPEIVEPALKYTALTFRKAFNSINKKDILQRSWPSLLVCDFLWLFSWVSFFFTLVCHFFTSLCLFYTSLLLFFTSLLCYFLSLFCQFLWHFLLVCDIFSVFCHFFSLVCDFLSLVCDFCHFFH